MVTIYSTDKKEASNASVRGESNSAYSSLEVFAKSREALKSSLKSELSGLKNIQW
mgnify:FL=1